MNAINVNLSVNNGMMMHIDSLHTSFLITGIAETLIHMIQSSVISVTEDGYELTDTSYSYLSRDYCCNNPESIILNQMNTFATILYNFTKEVVDNNSVKLCDRFQPGYLEGIHGNSYEIIILALYRYQTFLDRAKKTRKSVSEKNYMNYTERFRKICKERIGD